MRGATPFYIRLLAVYAAAVFGGCIMLTAENLVVLDWTLDELWEFHLKALATGAVLFILLLQLITVVRLKSAAAWLRGEANPGSRPDAFKSLAYFPAFMFRIVMVLSVVFSLLYHLFEAVYYGDSFLSYSTDDILELLSIFVSEQTIAFVIAFLLFVLLRRSLRSYLVQMQLFHDVPPAGDSLLGTLLIAFVSCFFIVMGNTFFYIHEHFLSKGRPVLAGHALLVWGCYLIVGTAVFLWLTGVIRKELRVLIDGIRSLTDGSRQRLHDKIAIISTDQIGQLTETFNRLQERVRRRYEEAEKDLQLAHHIQKTMLPEQRQVIGSWQITIIGEPATAVGGDLFDVVAADDHRLAIMLGTVSGGGLSAALAMSAVMVLFRAEIRQGGSSSDILTRLNRILSDMTEKDMHVTIGVALIAGEEAEVRYAGAGNRAPLLFVDGRQEPYKYDLSPLGMDADESYTEMTVCFRNEIVLSHRDNGISVIVKSAETL